jgi:hypothetical protein
MILGPWWVMSNLTNFYVKKMTALLWTRPILNADVLITMTASTQAEHSRVEISNGDLLHHSIICPRECAIVDYSVALMLRGSEVLRITVDSQQITSFCVPYLWQLQEYISSFTLNPMYEVYTKLARITP